MTLTELFTDIANSLRAKTGKEDKIVAENFPNEIDSIKSMADTNDATATAEDIVEGKTAYVKEEKIVGTMKASEYNAKIMTEGYVKKDTSYKDDFKRMLVTIPFIDTSEWTSMYCLFENCTNLKKIDLKGWDTSKVTTMYDLFYNCTNVEEIDLTGIDTSNVTTFWAMFQGCTNLKRVIGINTLNTSQVTSMYNLFNSCTNIEEIDLSGWDFSNVDRLDNAFRNALNLKKIIANNNELNTIKMTNISNCFNANGSANNSLITDIPVIRADSLINLQNIFQYNHKQLINFGGLKYLGKAYTQKTANYSNYKSDLSYCTALTLDSLINIANGVYDLNLTYDVANDGTLYPQTIQFGPTNLAKLEATEEGQQALAELVLKGWNAA